MTSPLLVRPRAATELVHDVTVESARTPLSPDWSHVGFALHRLDHGRSAIGDTGEREAILVVVEGLADASVDGQSLGTLGERMDVFERLPPASVYVPPGSRWEVRAASPQAPLTLAVCTAPGRGGHPARVLDRPALTERGTGTNTRYIHNIAMEDADVADSLLVTEVFTPAGHWSSYPPHRHDEDDFPRMTYLEETYYHRLHPATGFGVQRVFTDDRGLDETIAVSDGDVVLVPRGHHPCAAPHGVEMYYLNVMAGPRRAWRFETHPDFEWLVARDG